MISGFLDFYIKNADWNKKIILRMEVSLQDNMEASV